VDTATDVKVIVIDNVRSRHRRVEERKSLQRGHHGLDEEGHVTELDAMALFKALLVAVAQFVDVAEIDFVKCRQQGLGGLGQHQTLGNALAQARHGDPPLGACAVRCARPDGGADGTELAAAATRSDLATRPSFAAAAIVAPELEFIGHALCRRAEFGRPRSLRHAWRQARRTRSGRSGSGRARGSGLEHGQQIAVLDRAARRRGFPKSRPPARGFHDLVGLEVPEAFIPAHGIARLLAPRDQRRVGHRLGQLRHADLDSHLLVLCLTAACGAGAG
jgi:hypothetical protein